MSSNSLGLSSNKAPFICLGTGQSLAKLDMVALISAFPQFTFSSVVRDLVLLSHWIKILLLLPTFARFVVTIIASSVNFAQFPGRVYHYA